MRAAGGLPAVLLAVFVLAAPAAGQGVTVAFAPSLPQVAPGEVFTLDIAVTASGSQFNGFDAVVVYDPAALTLIPATPLSLQEGSLMTGACGNTFHLFEQGAASDTIIDVLLCNGVFVTGPGQIYRLTFRASTTPQVTSVRFLEGPTFYDAGIIAHPVDATNAVVGIGLSPVGVESPTPPAKIDLRVAPNPTSGGTVFTTESSLAGPQTITVVDLSGRLVRRFESVYEPVGGRMVAWDGRDVEGRPVAAGVYYAKLEAGGRTVAKCVSVVR